MSSGKDKRIDPPESSGKPYPPDPWALADQVSQQNAQIQDLLQQLSSLRTTIHQNPAYSPGDVALVSGESQFVRPAVAPAHSKGVAEFPASPETTRRADYAAPPVGSHPSRSQQSASPGFGPAVHNSTRNPVGQPVRAEDVPPQVWRGRDDERSLWERRKG